jgi:hypothetical protein
MHDEEKENRPFIMHIPQILFSIVCDQVLRFLRYHFS